MTEPLTLAALVEKLEEVRVVPGEVDVDELKARLAERQTILTQIQQSDAGDLDPETRRALCERIRRIRDRDTRLLAHLAERRDDVGKRIDSVLHARNAARGYRPAETDPTRGRGRLA